MTTHWQNRIISYGTKAADQFTANPANPRLHPQYQRDVMKAVLDKLGWIAPVIENQRTGYLVDGHERVMQALARNEAVPYVVVDLTPEEEATALATFDPITALATYDREALDSLLRDVATDSAVVDKMLAELAEANGLYPEQDTPPGDAGAQLDRAGELQEKYGVKRGQIWGIGRHRIMCGDSYSTEQIALLMDGKQAGMLHTDPPYGINIVKPKNGSSAAAIGGAKPFGSTAPADRKGITAVAFRNSGKVGGGRGDEASRHAHDVGRVAPANIVQSNLYPVIEGDDKPFDPLPFITFAPVVILWGANYYADKLPIKACWIAWDKREDITRNNFADCELAWTNQNSPARLFHHLWNGLHKGSQHGERRIHPTEKPVALFEEIGNMFCPKELWVDLFAGSGAQIEAAERAGATCYAMEYEPLYVACVLERMANLGLIPQRISENNQ